MQTLEQGKDLLKFWQKNNYIVGITGIRYEPMKELVRENLNFYIPKIIDVCQLQNLKKLLNQILDILGNLDLKIT